MWQRLWRGDSMAALSSLASILAISVPGLGKTSADGYVGYHQCAECHSPIY